jgi:hypothetical protein
MRKERRGGKEVSLRPARKQREVIRDVMLSAGQCATWLTLDELAKLTQYPPASISAQLRHLRKPRFGGFAVVKRSRAVNKAMRAEGVGTLWEYAIEPVQRIVANATKRSRARRQRERAREKKGVCRRDADAVRRQSRFCGEPGSGPRQAGFGRSLS